MANLRACGEDYFPDDPQAGNFLGRFSSWDEMVGAQPSEAPPLPNQCLGQAAIARRGMVPLTMSLRESLAKDLCDHADHMREEGYISKKLFRQVLWACLEQVVMADETLQHAGPDPPCSSGITSGRSAASASAASASAADPDYWKGLPTCERIAAAVPAWSTQEVWAEYFVDKFCVEKFVTGQWPLEFARGDYDPAYEKHKEEEPSRSIARLIAGTACAHLGDGEMHGCVARVHLAKSR